MEMMLTSQAFLEQKRAHKRTVLMEQAIEEFKQNKPKYTALRWSHIQGHHWDLAGAQVQLGAYCTSLHGGQDTKLVDEEGSPSYGEAQASVGLVRGVDSGFCV